MRFHHAVLLAALAITPVCAERLKASPDERGIVDSTLSAVGGVDCGGGGSGGGLRCNDVGQRVRLRGISGSRRGEQDVSSPTANPRTTIPEGEIVARWGQSTLSTAVRGGESPARRGRRGRRGRANERRRRPQRRRRRHQRRRLRVVPPPAASRRRREDPAMTTVTLKRRL